MGRGGEGNLYPKGEAVKDAGTARMRGNGDAVTHCSCRQLALCQQA